MTRQLKVATLPEHKPSDEPTLADLLLTGAMALQEEDPVLYRLIALERKRQARVLSLVAASSVVHPSVLACEGATFVNVTAEGYPQARYHAGCEIIDQVEQLAIDRAKAAFRAAYANVQPRSATAANQIVMCGLLQPGDPILGMDLASGGHLSHGAPVSFSGRHFDAKSYGLTREGEIDFDQVRELALAHRPKLIVCGTTAYPRQIDFLKFRAIADDVDALLLADITHVAGLVASGLHPSPVDVAHVTTTCTHKQLFGSRGGLILMGRDHELDWRGEGRLSERIQRAVFPLFQGAPDMNSLAAKARGLARIGEPEFQRVSIAILQNARALAAALAKRGHHVVGGGTDNHLVILDVSKQGLTGMIAEKALERCGVIVNKNRIPGDHLPAAVGSGIRLGTNTVALKGMGPEEMELCAALISECLEAVEPLGRTRFRLDETLETRIGDRVAELCEAFPTPLYS